MKKRTKQAVQNICEALHVVDSEMKIFRAEYPKASIGIRPAKGGGFFFVVSPFPYNPSFNPLFSFPMGDFLAIDEGVK